MRGRKFTRGYSLALRPVHSTNGVYTPEILQNTLVASSLLAGSAGWPVPTATLMIKQWGQSDALT